MEFSPGTPIIVVSGNPQAPLNIWNVDMFLRSKMWEAPDVCRKRAEAQVQDPTSLSKPRLKLLQRTSPTAAFAEVKVIDTVTGLDRGMYDRIVAIFADGAEWQFKGWRWDKKPGEPDLTPVDIFNRCPGFYVCFDDQQDHIPDSIRRWPVRKLVIARKSRHHDGVAVEQFWSAVDEFVQTKRPQLTLPPAPKRARHEP